MSKLEVFLIELDRESAVYFAGEEVVGRLVVILRENMKMRAIRMKFVGKAHNNWKQTFGGGDRSTTLPLHAEEHYSNQELTLWGKLPNVGGENPVLQMGSHTFPFRFKLPPDCPTSFECAEGHIRYTCKATIDKPWKSDDTTKRAFTVIMGIHDLNRDPFAPMGVNLSEEKVVGWPCCPDGHMECQISTPKRGYVAGECIPLLGSFSNSSSRVVRRIELILMQHMLLSGSWDNEELVRRGKISREVVNVILALEVPARQSVQFNGQGQCAIRIPPVPPMLFNCGIIQIDYSVRVKVFCESGQWSSMSLDLFIIIGTIPLRSAFDQFREQTTADFLPLPIDDYPQLPPPVYAESVFGKSNIKEKEDSNDIGGELEFAPRYTYYGWAQNPQPSQLASP